MASTGLTRQLVIHSALRDVSRFGPAGYSGRFKDLLFLVTADNQHGDGRWWIHASVSRRDKTLPTWADLQALKHYCIGDDKTAYQVLPAEQNYVHAPPSGGKTEVLHLWHCMDGDPLPEFSGVLPDGRRTI
jgi:hypothetical protein